MADRNFAGTGNVQAAGTERNVPGIVQAPLQWRKDELSDNFPRSYSLGLRV